jgi:hypothetical protein
MTIPAIELNSSRHTTGHLHRAHDDVLPARVVAFFDNRWSIYVIPRDLQVNAKISARVPVGDMTHLPFVETTTAAVVLACFVYLAAICMSASRRLDQNARAKNRKVE